MEFKTIDRDKIFIKIADFGKGIPDVKKAMEPMFSTEEEKEMSGMGFTVMESFCRVRAGQGNSGDFD